MEFCIEDKILKNVQEIQIEILNEVCRICEKYELTYFLTGGTLLGAIRHEGFIPWDDDLDIVMPRKDYIEFMKIANIELDKMYYIHSQEIDKTYWCSFIKVRKHGTKLITKEEENINKYNGIFIDIFPLDDAKYQRSIKQDVQALLVKSLKSVIIRKKGLIVNHTTLLTKILYYILLPFSIETLSLWRDVIMQISNNEELEYYVNLGSNYNYVKQTIHKKRFYPIKKVKFGEKLYNAPNDYKIILERIYGKGYMELPPIEERRTHEIINVSFYE